MGECTVKMFGGVAHVLVGEFDRFYAEALVRKLGEAGIPARLVTPFDGMKAYAEVYGTAASVWVPREVYRRALRVLEE